MRSLRGAKLKALYWIATLLFVLPQTWSALQYLMEAPRMTNTLAQLGYPAYFQHILGVAKLLGVVAIVSGVSTTLKEWAYAGFTFDVLGALVSHVSVKDAFWVVLVPALFLVVQFGSYALWRRLEARHAVRRRRYLLGERVRELAESGV
jgi:uncharacterized membrane protein YphA (DoxX/SURF4 family)